MFLNKNFSYVEEKFKVQSISMPVKLILYSKIIFYFSRLFLNISKKIANKTNEQTKKIGLQRSPGASRGFANR